MESLPGGAVDGGVVVGIELGSGAHGDGVGSGFSGEPSFVLTVETDYVEVALQGADFSRGVVNKLLFEIHSGYIIYFPIALCDLAEVFSIEAYQIKMASAGALAGPDELLAGGIDLGEGVNVDPIGIGFAEDLSDLAGFPIGGEEFQLVLNAGHALDADFGGVHPGDTGEERISGFAEVHPTGLGGFEVHDAEADVGVGGAQPGGIVPAQGRPEF